MTTVRTFGAWGLTLTALAALTGCTHTVKVEPIKVEPIDITLHIYLEADAKLDSFFNDLDKPSPSPATTPAAKPDHTEGGHP